VLPGHPLARHIDDFLTDLANANKPRNTIRGDLIGFAAHYDGEITGLSATPIRAFLGEVAGQAPSTRKRKRAAVASFCKWAVRHELVDASPTDRIDTIEVPQTLRPRHGKLLISAPFQPGTQDHRRDTDHPCIKRYTGDRRSPSPSGRITPNGVALSD
jgi:site-specific recombinase XerD